MAGRGSISNETGILSLSNVVNHKSVVRLKLAKESFSRKIGFIHYFDGEVVYHKKENKDGIFRKFNAFGFCNDLIVYSAPSTIIVDYKARRYVISMDRFEENKKYINFKKKGFELRCFVPIEYFKKKRIK